MNQERNSAADSDSGDDGGRQGVYPREMGIDVSKRYKYNGPVGKKMNDGMFKQLYQI